MLDHRYIAKIILEAETPLFVGSGETSILSDAVVMKDAYGYPMIPGASIAGVLRHSIEDAFSDNDKEQWQSFFGFQKQSTGSGKGEGEGSKLRVSSAYLILNNKIPDGNDEEYWEKFQNLPRRQHVRIDDRGTAEDKGLFDNEVVYKGCRFVFEMELRGSIDDKENWEKVLDTLASPLFRIGQGTRNGYGKLRVDKLWERDFDLKDPVDFKDYLEYDNSLKPIQGGLKERPSKNQNDLKCRYTLKLQPELGFIFGAGTGDDEVDAMPVREPVVTYDEKGNICFEERQIFIPASSIKGALRHRTCFYYNKRKGRYAEVYAAKKELRKLITGVENKAVYELFGAEGGWSGLKQAGCFEDSKSNDKRPPKRGHVLIDDVFLSEAQADKIFNHVSIDRFTGGAMDGFLFSEKVATLKNDDDFIEINISIVEPICKLESDTDTDTDTDVVAAFEDALKDVCRGLLPLGGMATKGHGIFTGTLFRNNDKIYEYGNENYNG